MAALQATILGIVLTASTAALADPTTLVCDENGTAGFYSFDGPVTVDLDEAARSVTVHYPGVTFQNNPGHMEAHSMGPTPGIFDADTISFSISGQNFAINRVTGEAVIHADSGQAMAERWNCRAGKKQF